MNYITTRDGTSIFYKEWGYGEPVVFIHGWPLNADAWDDQMKCVADNGFRGIAHDRRGHGRSTQTWNGYDFNTFADDLNDLMTQLNLMDVTLVAHSMGGGELARFIGRHGTQRVRKAVLLSSVTPHLLQGPDNPDGVPQQVFDDIKNGLMHERSQYWQDTAVGFFGANRQGSMATMGNQHAFWTMAMQSSLEASVKCVDAFSRTDFTEDLKKFDVPTLVIQGDADQVVPLEVSGNKSVQIIPDATLNVYEDGPHGLAMVPGYKEQFNQDLLDFLKS
jgi:non-heme chloroperoxidase